jgi:hypothetical protein
MADLVTATKAAVFARLTGQVGAPVFDHVPDEQLPPVVVIDRIDTAEVPVKGDNGLLDVSVLIQVVAQGRSRDPFRAIMWSVRQRLQNWTPAGTASALFGEARVISSGETTLADGLTHIGDLSIQLFVQPA